MADEQNKKELAELRAFLMKKFLLILAVVTALELGVFGVINRLFLPLLQSLSFGNDTWETHLGAAEILTLLILFLAKLIVAAIGGVLPQAAQRLFQSAVGFIGNLGARLVPQMADSFSLSLGRQEGFLLFIGIFAAVLLLLLPYAAGALWYAKIASEHVNKLQKRREELAAEYNRRRNRMLSDIAHDLRTPMTTVAGYAKAISDGMVDNPQKMSEYLEAIMAKSDRMNELVQLLFEYVRLDSDGFSLNKKQTDLAELLRKNAALMYSDIEEAGMKLEVDIPEEPYMAEADELQFSRVITNLLTNAIRHNGAGTKLLLSFTAEDGRMEIVVGDTGEKIAPELAAHLFEPFVMGDGSRNTKGGSGLGLSIAHKIVEMHGWELSYSEELTGCSKGFRICGSQAK